MLANGGVKSTSLRAGNKKPAHQRGLIEKGESQAAFFRQAANCQAPNTPAKKIMAQVVGSGTALMVSDQLVTWLMSPADSSAKKSVHAPLTGAVSKLVKDPEVACAA
jgi:hypothetical protein